MYQAAYRTQEYRQHEISNASPLHLVVMAYDLAIHACEQKDFEKAVKTISVLRDLRDAWRTTELKMNRPAASADASAYVGSSAAASAGHAA